MLQDLAALAPPVIVCIAFLIGAWVIVRRELAPKRRQRAADEAAADEERSADQELGRRLYFTTSGIYRAALGEYAAELPSYGSVRLRRWQARAGDLLTVCQLFDTSREQISRTCVDSSSGVLSVYAEVRCRELSKARPGYMFGILI
jgi:hypothetical protein